MTIESDEIDSDGIDSMGILSDYVHCAPLGGLRKLFNVSCNEDVVKYFRGDLVAPMRFPALSVFFSTIWERCCRETCRKEGLTNLETFVILVGAAQSTALADAVAYFLSDSWSMDFEPHERMTSFLRLLRVIAPPASDSPIRRPEEQLSVAQSVLESAHLY